MLLMNFYQVHAGIQHPELCSLQMSTLAVLKHF